MQQEMQLGHSIAVEYIPARPDFSIFAFIFDIFIALLLIATIYVVYKRIKTYKIERRSLLRLSYKGEKRCI